MEKTKFSFAMVIAILAILVGAYIALMGMVYLLNGALVGALAFSGVFAAVSVVSLWIVCRAKANRYKRQRKLGYYIFVPLLSLSVIIGLFPISHFVNIVSAAKELGESYKTAVSVAGNIPSEYDRYKAERVAGYRSHLENIKSGKVTEEVELFGKLPGNTDDERIENAVKHLNSMLEVKVDEASEAERKEWLGNASNFAVWSFSTTQNLDVVNAEVEKWVGDYRKQSEKTLAGETCEPFKLIAFDDAMAAIKKKCTTMSMPSVVSIIVIILFVGLVVLPYILTSSSIVGATSQRTENYE